jgi:hypothetical protein
VLIVVDTLRSDHLPSYGYPRAAAPRLADEGLLFERVIAPSSWTKTSMASIMTGLNPDRHAVRGVEDVLSDALPTLATAFSDAGYATLGVNTNPWLEPSFGFSRGFDLYETRVFSPASEVNRIALSHLREQRQTPFLLYVHYMDVHAPYRFREEPSIDLYGAWNILGTGRPGDRVFLGKDPVRVRVARDENRDSIHQPHWPAVRDVVGAAPIYSEGNLASVDLVVQAERGGLIWIGGDTDHADELDHSPPVILVEHGERRVVAGIGTQVSVIEELDAGRRPRSRADLSGRDRLDPACVLAAGQKQEHAQGEDWGEDSGTLPFRPTPPQETESTHRRPRARGSPRRMQIGLSQDTSQSPAVGTPSSATMSRRCS